MGFIILFLINFEIKDYLNAIKYKTPAYEYAKDSIIKIGEEALPFLLEILKDKREEIDYKIEICDIIGKIKSNKAIPVLNSLLNDPHPGLRGGAIKALGEIGDTSSFSYIVKMLNDPHDLVRREAIIALKSINDKRSIPFLKKALLKEKDYTNISEIIKVFGYFKAKETINEIFYFLKAKEENVKISAIYAIGEIGEVDEKIIDTLLLYLETENDYIKREIINALGKLKIKKAVRKIAEFLHSNNMLLKKEAIISLANIESDSSLIYLITAVFDPQKEIQEFTKKILKEKENMKFKLKEVIEDREKELKIRRGAFEIIKEIYSKEEIINILKKIFPNEKNEIYELILNGKIKEGMTEEEVYFSKGEPKRIAFYKSKRKKEWEYENEIIEFEGSKVIKIKSILKK